MGVKMKKIAILFTIFILMSISMINIDKQATPQIKLINNKPTLNANKNIIRSIKHFLPNDSTFKPEDITLKDDAFHGTKSFNRAEWWYFDAIFDNGYSIQITIYVFDVFSNKIIVNGVNIYNNGTNVLSREEYYVFNNLYISKEIPLIEINDKQILKGYIDEISGDWIYNLSVDVVDASIDLQFKGNSKGWKGNLSIGGWAVIFPKAEVNGTIELFGIEKEFIGIGYHDHNWDMNIFDLINYGWYWGKIYFENYSIVWFVIMNNRFNSEYICLISKDGGDYKNFNPNDIYFIAKDYQFEKFWWIPTSFILKVDINNTFFAILMNAFTVDTHMNIRLGRYSRYHLNCLGNIVIDNDIKNLSGIQIAEFMRFRFI
jgi:hypothetical protein